RIDDGILKLAPPPIRIGTRRSYLCSTLKLSGLQKYVNKNKESKHTEYNHNNFDMKSNVEHKYVHIPTISIPRETKGEFPLLPEVATYKLEEVSKSTLGWTKRQYPVPKMIRVEQVFKTEDHFVDPWKDLVDPPLKDPRRKLLETLLQVLAIDEDCGHYFGNFVTKCQDSLAISCMYLWHNIDSYHHMFYRETFDLFKVTRQANFIYSQFIARNSP
ncbi:hypothetical protein Ahia01_001366700, partial [Argonauta hians]